MSKDELLREYIHDSINRPIQGLLSWVDQGDWDTCEDILSNLLERTRERIGIRLVKRDKGNDGLLKEIWILKGGEK